MIFFNKNRQYERALVSMRSALSASFSNVRHDTGLIFQWLSYFNQRFIQQDELIQSQRDLISAMHREIALIPKSEDIRRMIDESYLAGDMLERIDAIEKRIQGQIDSLKGSIQKPLENHVSNTAPSSDVSSLQRRLERLEGRKAALKEKLIKRITKNSKDYVRSVILSMIRKYGNISAMQLKEMIVEEQGLASKSSFYRILEEIECSDEIGVIRKGKEKHYLAKMSPKGQKE